MDRLYTPRHSPQLITTAIKSSPQTAYADKGTRISGAPFFQLAVRHSDRARRSVGAGACTGARATRTDSAGAHGALGRRGADRAAGILRRRRSASIRLVLITNHIATHVPALVGSCASRSRACSGSLCIC
jgi:hypothetical protein